MEEIKIGELVRSAVTSFSLRLAACASLSALGLYWYLSRGKTDNTRSLTPGSGAGLGYEALRRLVETEQLPAMFVDLDAFDHNVSTAASICRQAKKTLRLASKSIRVPDLIARCLRLHPDVFRGIMCFSVHEALCLAELLPEARDFLIGYPCVQKQDVEAAITLQRKYRASVLLMIDCVEHVQILDRLWHALDPAGSLTVCVDIDASYRPFNSLAHIGAHRSPCHNVAALAAVVSAIEASQHLRFGGLMNYEAQIAGVPDKSTSLLMDIACAVVKALSHRDVTRNRARMREYLNMVGLGVPLFNGGGTGNLRDAVCDPGLTEVTMGSGFLQSAIFDNFHDHWRRPALFFGLRVTRSCQPGIVCCQSGGFIASGQTGLDKSPRVYLPSHFAPFPHEGFGEVQTPLYVTGSSAHNIGIGDPIFFRPAKAGEIAEHFNEYVLVRGDTIAGRARTYRGLGKAFY
eukprot:m.31478 g.31478  ORF g.31478 m.31478 type:complete len:460 (-) comp9318_c0_seq1:32-1411(-)